VRCGVQKWPTEGIKIAGRQSKCFLVYIHADMFGAGHNGYSFLQELRSHSKPTPKGRPLVLRRVTRLRPVERLEMIV
jgi:hypothetical protein